MRILSTCKIVLFNAIRLIILTCSFIQCMWGAEDPSGQKDEQLQPLSFITDQTSPPTKAFIKQVVERWNSDKSRRPVKHVFIDHEELRGLLESYLTSSNPPDILTWFAGNRMKSFIDRELMIKTASISGISTLNAALQPRFQRMIENGDARYFLPTSYYWWGIYYRPSIFKEAGIDMPINNWQELTVAAEKLRSKSIVPFALGSRYRCAATAWFDYLNMRLNGPEFHQQLLDLKIPYTDERVKRVLSFFRKLQESGWFGSDKANSYDEEEAVGRVFSGKAGMTLIGSYVQDEYVPSDSIEHLDFFRFPIIDESIPIGEDTPIDGFFAAGRSKFSSDAGDFLLYLGSKEVQELASRSITAIPTRADIDFKNVKKDVAIGREMIDRADRLFQFYDLDTVWEISNVGMSGINEFVSYESDESTVLQRIEKARLGFLHRSD